MFAALVLILIVLGFIYLLFSHVLDLCLGVGWRRFLRCRSLSTKVGMFACHEVRGATGRLRLGLVLSLVMASI